MTISPFASTFANPVVARLRAGQTLGPALGQFAANAVNAAKERQRQAEEDAALDRLIEAARNGGREGLLGALASEEASPRRSGMGLLGGLFSLGPATPGINADAENPNRVAGRPSNVLGALFGGGNRGSTSAERSIKAAVLQNLLGDALLSDHDRSMRDIELKQARADLQTSLSRDKREDTRLGLERERVAQGDRRLGLEQDQINTQQSQFNERMSFERQSFQDDMAFKQNRAGVEDQHNKDRLEVERRRVKVAEDSLAHDTQPPSENEVAIKNAERQTAEARARTAEAQAKAAETKLVGNQGVPIEDQIGYATEAMNSLSDAIKVRLTNDPQLLDLEARLATAQKSELAKFGDPAAIANIDKLAKAVSKRKEAVAGDLLTRYNDMVDIANGLQRKALGVKEREQPAPETTTKPVKTLTKQEWDNALRHFISLGHDAAEAGKMMKKKGYNVE